MFASTVPSMEVEFDDDDLDRLETDAQFAVGFSQEAVRAFRMATGA